MPNSYLNRNRDDMKCEVWIRLAGLDHANHRVLLDWFGVDGTDLRSFADSTNIGDVELCYSSSRNLKEPMLVGVGKVSNECQQRRQDRMLLW